MTNTRAISDIGGKAAGAIDTAPHRASLTERRIDAMMMVLRRAPRAFWTPDENRRTIESLTPEFYEGSAYYARWVWAMRALLLEKGVLTEDEIQAKLAEVRARLAEDAAP